MKSVRPGKRRYRLILIRSDWELIRFVVESINVPEEDESIKRLKKALADKAEIDILGQDSYKMKRTFDTMEKAAGNEGAGVMNAGMGLGMGAGMGAMMPGMMQNMMSGAAQGSAKILCPSCRAENDPSAKFCAKCGKEMASSAKCPKCNAATAPGAKFCPECGQSLAEGKCAKCNAVLAPGAKFCPSCGEKTGA